MSTGVSAVATVTSGSMWLRVRLVWVDLRTWSKNLLRALFGEVLCLTAGDIN